MEAITHDDIDRMKESVGYPCVGYTISHGVLVMRFFTGSAFLHLIHHNGNWFGAYEAVFQMQTETEQ